MKFIELHEAAKLLGITPDALNEMRGRNELSGYRDGSTWKFKIQDIERLAQQKGAVRGEPDDDFDLDVTDSSDGDLHLDLDDSSEADSILVSERELGQSDDTTSSTIIGKADPLGSADSDIRIGETDDAGSELRLADSASSVLSGGKKKPGPSDTANLDELKLSSSSGSLDVTEDSEISLGGSALELDKASKASSSGFGSAIDLDLDDDELVLGSGTGSDVTAGAGDSGINLANPSDSGLSLEDPLELGLGSSESLELGEDDMLAVSEAADSDSTKLRGDDDFLLSPVDFDAEDESSDSGSQVIDLDSEEFDESAATMLAENATPRRGTAGAVDFEAIDEDDDGLLEVAAAPATAALSSASRHAAEPQYSVANVLSLFAVFCVLGLSGMMLLDLISNIWSWERNLSFNSTIMDAILGMLGNSS